MNLQSAVEKAAGAIAAELSTLLNEARKADQTRETSPAPVLNQPAERFKLLVYDNGTALHVLTPKGFRHLATLTDPVAAVNAGVEWLIDQSAMLPAVKHLPPFVAFVERVPGPAPELELIVEYRRGLRQTGENGNRRWLRSTAYKLCPWLTLNNSAR
jgi:hypothetical protein